jgi:hypothetical protein
VKLVHLLLLGDVSKVGLKEKVKNCKKKKKILAVVIKEDPLGDNYNLSPLKINVV